jgi:hypothetical protein
MDEGQDVLEQGGGPRLPWAGWHPSRGAGVLAVATLAIGLVAGYAVGRDQGRSAAAPGRPAAAASQSQASQPTLIQPAASQSAGYAGSLQITEVSPTYGAVTSAVPLTQQPGTCARLTGDGVQLGIPVTNNSAQTAVLRSVKLLFSGAATFKVLSWSWEQCGHAGNGPAQFTLAPDGVAWVTVVVRQLTACPPPGPVQFQVSYSVDASDSTVTLPGFTGPGAAGYHGCPTAGA